MTKKFSCMKCDFETEYYSSALVHALSHSPGIRTVWTPETGWK